MHYANRLIAAALVSGVAGASAAVAQPPTDLVKPRIVADVSGVQAEQTFTLGVVFDMKPDWHIYWHNPGESGLATSVRFELPEGMKVGPLQWPAPMRFVQPGDILGYGYKDSVLLAAKVTAPEDLSGKSFIPVRAKLRWLSCKDVCIPGRAELDWNLPVSDAPAPANGSLFKQWESRLPVAPVSAGVQVATRGKLPSDGSPGQFTLHLRFKSPPESVEWFPYESDALRVSGDSVELAGNKATVRFEIALLKGHTLSSHELPTVITFTDAAGRTRALRALVRLDGAGGD